MKETNQKNKVAALRSAACAVTAHNAELAAHFKRGVAIFTEVPPISERLKCETNGAHRYIEDFATALKALARGCAPVKRTMKELRESCRDLILKLKETEKLLPDSVSEADRRAFLDGIELAETEEVSFYNLVTGESGAEPDFPHELYCQRIDNSVNSLKKKLTRLNIAIQHIERDLRRKAPPADLPPAPNEPAQPTGEPSGPKRQRRRPQTGELRQKDVARAFGVSRQTVARWEARQTEDGPDNASNPWGYYRSLRTNPELRTAFEMLSNQVKAYASAKEEAARRGVRFRITFVSFREEWIKHAKM